VRKAVAFAAVAAATATTLGWAGASVTPNSRHHQVLDARSVETHTYFVDSDPSGASGGDLAGSAGDLRRGGQKVGDYESACTLSPPVGAQCQATLIWRSGGRLQLAGNIHLQRTQNRISIIGGTGKFRNARGDGIIQAVGNQGAIQHIHLTLLR
jgi:hypothetical protein